MLATIMHNRPITTQSMQASVEVPSCSCCLCFCSRICEDAGRLNVNAGRLKMNAGRLNVNAGRLKVNAGSLKKVKSGFENSHVA